MALSKIVARVSICMIVEYPQVMIVVAKKLVAEIAELKTLLDAYWDEVGCRMLVIRRYAYAVADFDLPLSCERFIEVVNGCEMRELGWRALRG